MRIAELLEIKDLCTVDLATKSSLQLNRSTKDQLQIIRTVSTQVKKLQH